MEIYPGSALNNVVFVCFYLFSWGLVLSWSLETIETELVSPTEHDI